MVIISVNEHIMAPLLVRTEMGLILVSGPPREIRAEMQFVDIAPSRFGGLHHCSNFRMAPFWTLI